MDSPVVRFSGIHRPEREEHFGVKSQLLQTPLDISEESFGWRNLLFYCGSFWGILLSG